MHTTHLIQQHHLPSTQLRYSGTRRQPRDDHPSESETAAKAEAEADLEAVAQQEEGRVRLGLQVGYQAAGKRSLQPA
eukprot:CAMPEP_0196739024 /NCGR_PEP_ID=MMETSP1091-20130531/19006_1 /TAXON_ID=302021 /ORGANISM="Rhodomonas sp., Strain CCMP768" /LENGTH=76 /DNA_ID=CAMNT_0042083239 /DNA_START=44 /DNA_END=271 /DNA_ORIENTATION=-